MQKVARVGFWDMDRVHDELIWSEMVYEIFQLDPEEYAPSLEAFWDLVHPDDREIGRQTMAESLFNQTPYDFVHRLLLSDGTVKWVHERARTRYDSDGTALRTLGTMADITAARETEDRLRQAPKMSPSTS